MTLKVELPDRVAEQLKELVRAGWFLTYDEVVSAAVREYLSRHRFELAEEQQLADIDWALRTANPAGTP